MDSSPHLGARHGSYALIAMEAHRTHHSTLNLASAILRSDSALLSCAALSATLARKAGLVTLPGCRVADEKEWMK